jgi:hypothetical protein
MAVFHLSGFELLLQAHVAKAVPEAGLAILVPQLQRAGVPGSISAVFVAVIDLTFSAAISAAQAGEKACEQVR